jgi:pimeloyl-ACP methyl ester carboxylesterase
MASILRYKAGKINYEITGKGFPVVLIHGYLENLTIWSLLIPLLKSQFQFISIDLPGHGKSDFFKLKNIDSLADAVDAVVAKLQLEKFHIIGHSMGGYVALAYFEKHKAKCSKICLFHSTASADSQPKKIDRDRAIKAIKIAFDKYVYLITPNLFSKSTFVFMKNEMIEFIQIAKQTNPNGAIEAIKAMKNRPNREYLVAKYPERFYYLLGEFDQLLPLEKMDAELADKPDVKFNYLENTGHLGLLECPSKVAEFLNDEFFTE